MNMKIRIVIQVKMIIVIMKIQTARWYLEHVYPESQMPLDYFFLGEMRNDASHNCLDTMGRKSGEEVKKRIH